MVNVDLTSLQAVWRVLFDGLPFGEEEWIEVAYDTLGNREYARCYHLRSFEELLEKVKLRSGQCNMVISPAVKSVPLKDTGKRTGKNAIVRQKAIVLDVDSPGHTFLTEEEASVLAFSVYQKLPERIREAVALVGYTGGGIQLYLVFEVLEGLDQVEKAYRLLKRILSDVEEIDPASFTPGQLQRLLGTLNLKYEPPALAKVVRAFENPKPLNLVELEAMVPEEKRGGATLKNGVVNSLAQGVYKVNGGYIINLPEAKKEIRKRVRVADLGLLELENRGHYSVAFCPFHDDGSRPGFAVYHNEDFDLVIDFHTNECMDVVEFYSRMTGKSEEEAVQDLSVLAGVKLKLDRQKKKELEREQKLASFDPKAYVDALPIVALVKFVEDGVISFEITVRNVEDFTYTFKATIEDLVSWRKFSSLFLRYSGVPVPYIEPPIREHALRQVVEEIRQRARRSEFFWRDSGEELVDTLLGELARGWFGSFKDFLRTTEFYAGFVGHDGHYYTTLAILKKLVKSMGFEVSQNRLRDELLRAGCQYVNYYDPETGQRKRAYRLPKDFRPLPSMDKVNGADVDDVLQSFKTLQGEPDQETTQEQASASVPSEQVKEQEPKQNTPKEPEQNQVQASGHTEQKSDGGGSLRVKDRGKDEDEDEGGGFPEELAEDFMRYGL